jgi:hypothetical protein
MRDTILINNIEIDKHKKYKNKYKQSDLYWGLGIEHELYLEFDNKKNITENEFLNNHKHERYSIAYYNNYKKDYLDEAFKNYYNSYRETILSIPVLLNSHSFTKTDKSNNSKTLYTKNTEPNSSFEGKTLIEFLEEKDTYFKDNDSWLFDGDTIEFINNDFYNIQLNYVLEEIKNSKKIFITKLNNIFNKNNIYTEFGSIQFMKNNNPFACLMTNFNNISMFNNGTLHFNITLPTLLDDNCNIKNKEKFILEHQKYIKLIQWLEPLIIAVYGSPDPFSNISNYTNSKKFSGCSQRNIISRYIGLGIYNTDNMDCGKILTQKINEIPMNNLDYWWYNKFHENSAYNKLEEIGLDINFNKHFNHGIEIRFLDHISDEKLIYKCFEFLIYLADFILETNIELVNPIINKDWNNFLYNVMINGKLYNLSDKEIKIYEKIFKIKIPNKNIVNVYNIIFLFLKNKYNQIFKSLDDNTYYLTPIGNYSSLALENQIIQEDNFSIITYNKINENKKNNENKENNISMRTPLINETGEENINKCCIIC